MDADELEVAAGQIEDPDPRQRMEAARRLARFACAASDDRAMALELLGRLVHDEADFVRWNVAIALGQLGDPAGLPLLRALAADAHANVRLRVALAVALIGDPEGLDVLVDLADDPYEIAGAYPVRSFAALALGVLAASDGLEPLVRLAEDPDAQVRWHATVALGDLRDERATDALMARTTDEVPFVRAHAAIGLTQTGGTAGLEAVRKLAEGDPVERVRMIAGRALAATEGVGP